MIPAGLRSSVSLIPFALVLIASLPFRMAAAEKAIDSQRSSLTIHVGRAGLLSAAGHEHTIKAPIESGSVDDTNSSPSVRMIVAAERLEVTPDAKLSMADLTEVQSNMQSKVLESSKYPQIVFQSTRAEREGVDAWKVDGTLTLHGVTRPLTVSVRRDKDAYVGAVRIKQTDFGIQPIRVGGGLVTVKNELDVRFEVYCVPKL
jgi:polyisoprenoid-binding protein YceI